MKFFKCICSSISFVVVWPKDGVRKVVNYKSLGNFDQANRWLAERNQTNSKSYWSLESFAWHSHDSQSSGHVKEGNRPCFHNLFVANHPMNVIYTILGKKLNSQCSKMKDDTRIWIENVAKAIKSFTLSNWHILERRLLYKTQDLHLCYWSVDLKP